MSKVKVIERDNEFEIQGTFTVIVTKQDIDDIMVTALEGGITYWCGSAEVIEDTYYGEYSSEQISRGGSLQLYDYESDEYYCLTLDKFLRGIYLAIGEGYNDDWFFVGDATIDTSNIDAVAADIIIQMALFEELVYG